MYYNCHYLVLGITLEYTRWIAQLITRLVLALNRPPYFALVFPLVHTHTPPLTQLGI